MSISDPYPYEKCIDETPDILKPKTFAIASFLCILFGCFIGVGFHISLSSYNLTTSQAIPIIILLFLTGATPAIFLHWFRNRKLFGDTE